jgi:hypothetical protein
MKRFTLTIDIPATQVKPSVHVAQMLREAASVVEYPVSIPDHRHMYDHYGDEKYEWEVEDVADAPPARRAKV